MPTLNSDVTANILEWYNTNFQMYLKILLLKLGIKEVGMAKNCYKFPNTIISVQIFHNN
jgi:hypothetical protein